MPTFRQDEKLGTKVPLIKTADFKDKSVTTEKLAEGSVTNSKLAPESVTQDKFDKELLQIFEAAAGLPKNLIEMIQNVDSTLVDHQRQISSNDDDISDLQTKTKQIKDTVDGIAVSGGASVGSAVTYDNTQSGLDAQNIQNAIDELVNNLGHYETNEEWLRAYTDAEGKFLWGIRVDGSIDWAVGIPRPIQKKIEKLIATDTAIQESITQLRTEFTESLNNEIQSLKDNEIKNLQDTKVDKEEGKSLIEDEVKECFRVIENEEFIHAVIDSEGRLLFAIYRESGKPYFPLNEMYHVEQNKEFFAVWLDAVNHVLFGIRRDGQIIGEIHAVNALKQVISQLQSDVASLQEKVGTIDTNLKELLDVFSLQENPEYLAVEKDAEGKVLSATNPDGSHYIHNAKSETIPTEFSHIEDPEGRTEITTDAEGKVLSYRDAKGTKFEKNFKTDHLDLSDDGMTDFVKALNDSGFKLESSCDWSNYVSNNGENPLHLPIPQCAIINISNESHDAVWPVTKSNDYEYYMEYHDMLGNYFKKNIIMNAQGNSSMVMIKKNGAIDIFDSSVYDNKGKKGKGNTFGIKFGNWVTQDSFHLKAFYNDFFKGCSFVTYQIANEVMLSYGITKDRPWKRALIGDYIGTGQEGKSIDDISLQLDDGARCMPDGFPCIVYLNGDFYGIYSFALKKHRDNYHMKKKDGNHIHLDGTNIDFFNGKIDWSGFEVRNPKDSEMCCTSLKEGASEYLPYSGGKELLGDDAEHYNPGNKAHVLSNKVKRSIEKLSKRCQETNALSSNEEKKLYLARYFDVDSILDYILVATAVHDTDGGYANYQWITYDGEKWFVCNYDKDRSFGNGTEYMEQAITTGSWIYQNVTIFKLFEDLFSTELKEKWNGYVKKGIFTYDNFIGKISQWVQRIGQDNYKKEYSKWKQAPCNRDDNVNRDYWKTKCRAGQWYWWQSFKAGDFCFSQENEYKVYKALKSSNNVAVTNTEYWQDVTYSPETNYNVGDICGYGFHFGESFYVDNGFYVFEAIAASNNIPPISKIYDEYPRIMGYRDNIWRVSNYIEQTLNTIQKYVDNL
jgi:hypothetical protein